MQADCLAVGHAVDLPVVAAGLCPVVAAVQQVRFYDGLCLAQVHCPEVQLLYSLRVALADRRPVGVGQRVYFCGCPYYPLALPAGCQD